MTETRSNVGTNTQIIRPSNEPTRQSIKLVLSCHLSPPHDQLPLSNFGSHPTEHYPNLRSLLFLKFFFTPTAFESTISKIQIFSKPLYFHLIYIYIYIGTALVSLLFPYIFQCFKVWSKGRGSQLRGHRVTGVVLHCNQCILGNSCGCDQTAENGV